MVRSLSSRNPTNGSHFYFVITGTGADTIEQKLKSVHAVGDGEGIREYLTFQVHDETVTLVFRDADTDANHNDTSEKRIIDVAWDHRHFTLVTSFKINRRTVSNCLTIEKGCGRGALLKSLCSRRMTPIHIIRNSMTHVLGEGQ